MSLLSKIASRLGYAKSEQVANPPAWLRAQAASEQWSMPDPSQAEAQLAMYQKLSWVQIAVSRVAETAATAAFNVMLLDGETEQGILNHAFEQLLRRPNPLQSRHELLVSTISYLTLTGNAYWWLNRPSNGAPAEIWVLPSNQVSPVPDGNMYLRGYLYDAGIGNKVPLNVSEIVHFKRFNPGSSFVGLSPLEALGTVAVGDLAMQRWNTNWFSKDNAKAPGALAFATPIDDQTWAQMQKDIRDQWGGVNRSGPLMLRNVGPQGVQWIGMSLSQTDMQFLEGRNFTREEVFSVFAPGLASILSVNATEANAIAGKRTFLEFGVWPQLVAVAEKITNDVLPLYGPNLVGEFEDIRITDRVMELQEQAAFAQVHTIDEIRTRFYKAQPLGDERGSLLPAQVSPVRDTVQLQGTEQGQQIGLDLQPTDTGATSGKGQMQPQGGQGQEGQVEAAAEAKALRRWLKRHQAKSPDQFECIWLDDAAKAVIVAEIRGPVESYG